MVVADSDRANINDAAVKGDAGNDQRNVYGNSGSKFSRQSDDEARIATSTFYHAHGNRDVQFRWLVQVTTLD